MPVLCKFQLIKVFLIVQQYFKIHIWNKQFYQYFEYSKFKQICELNSQVLNKLKLK